MAFKKASFKFTEKQVEGREAARSGATHLLYDGGSRSGKTLLHCRNVAMRALMAPGSRHAILRFRFNQCKQSIVLDTFKKMMALCFPGVEYDIDKTDWYAKLGDGSEIWFGGLDDKDRTEKILGKEFVTIYLVECSQITWESVELVKTRLAQNVSIPRGSGRSRPMDLRMYYDCNPPSKAHWIYKLFKLKKDPVSGKPLTSPENYASVQMNPVDNKENLPSSYFTDVLADLSARQRNRFEYGKYSEATPGQLISEENIEKWRHTGDEILPDFVQVVVGVDPSGAGDEDNADNDAIGIIAGALGTDGKAYLLEDNTVKAGPATWARVAVNTLENNDGDFIVGEENYGGAMVKSTIRTENPRVSYRKVSATRGKHVRATPFAALYEQGKVVHVGRFTELEEELTAFSTSGYVGNKSPNRADAWIWVLAALFPALVKVAEKKAKAAETAAKTRNAGYRDHAPGAGGWMG